MVDEKLVEAAKSVVEAWPAVKKILMEYSEAFPYAELGEDDEQAIKLNLAVADLKKALESQNVV